MIDWLSLINWDALERGSGWGPSVGGGEFSEHFDDPDQVECAKTTAFSSYFDEQQAEALRLDPSDSVIDVCCGIGRLTIPMARRCRRVLGLDGSRLRVQAVEQLAAENALDNVTTVQANWHAVDPARDLPLFDVAVACNCPVAVDLAKFSRLARKRCIYLQGFSGPIPSMIEEALFSGVELVGSRRTQKSWGTEDYRETEKSTFYIAFNHLLSLGASPSVNYVDAGWHVEAADMDQLCLMLRRGAKIAERSEEVFRQNVAKHTEPWHGGVVFERRHTMAVLDWNAADVIQDEQNEQ